MRLPAQEQKIAEPVRIASIANIARKKAGPAEFAEINR
jgi:hypothetical protein